jgi:hypothetical protein
MDLPLNRYDLILLGVPLCYAAAILIGFTFDMPTTVSLGGGSVLGAALLGDALFRNPPGGQHGPPKVEHH